MRMLSFASPHVPQAIIATIVRLTSGSIHHSPLTTIASPATTTPTETSASAAMWRYAPRMLRSSCPRRKSSAVAVLMTTPTPATAIMTKPSGSCGSISLCIVSNRIAPIATASSSALAMAARMVELLNP